MTKQEARAKLQQRGFKYSHRVGGREYWRRTDGKPEIFLDHSATITIVGPQALVSDFVNDDQSVRL